MNRARTEIGPGIVVYDNVLDGDWLISIVESEIVDTNGFDDWEWSTTGQSGSRNNYRTSFTFPLLRIIDPNNDHPLQRDVKTKVLNSINNAYNDYSSRYLVEAGLMEPPTVLKYVAGGSYRTHSDAGPGIHRVVSCVGCLGNSSSGGDLEFPLLDVRIKLKEHQFIFFPSNFLFQHYAHPVTDGVKYSLVTWWGYS